MEVVITGRTKAGAILGSPSKRDGITHLVSIGDEECGLWGRSKLPFNFHVIDRRIRLRFDDVNEAVVPAAEAGFCAPTQEHIERLVRFASNIPDEAKVLIHCEYGVSRSTAAAYVLLAIALGSGNEREAYAQMIAAAPHARPNIRMVQLAGRILGRYDDLMGPLRAHESLRCSLYAPMD